MPYDDVYDPNVSLNLPVVSPLQGAHMLPRKPRGPFILEPQLVLGYKEMAGKQWHAAVCAAWGCIP